MLFNRKADKKNMLFRVFALCMLVILVILLLVFSGHHADSFNWNVWKFFEDHQFFLWYLIGMNIVTFTVFAVDKVAAIRGRSRVRIVTLLTLSFLGGSVGGFLAMHLFRHKTRKIYFSAGVPMMMLMHGIVILYMMNAAW